MKTKLILAAAFAFAVGAGARAASPKTPVVKNIKITGHPGMIIDKVISQRIMTEDVETCQCLCHEKGNPCLAVGILGKMDLRSLRTVRIHS